MLCCAPCGNECCNLPAARGPQLSAREDTSTLWQLGSLHRLTKIDLVLVVLAPRGSPLSWFGRFSDRPRRLTCLFGRANHLVLDLRSEEHTSELQSLMRISYAVF